jgi:hypothetical protein
MKEMSQEELNEVKKRKRFEDRLIIVIAKFIVAFKEGWYRAREEAKKREIEKEEEKELRRKQKHLRRRDSRQWPWPLWFD